MDSSKASGSEPHGSGGPNENAKVRKVFFKGFNSNVSPCHIVCLNLYLRQDNIAKILRTMLSDDQRNPWIFRAIR